MDHMMMSISNREEATELDITIPIHLDLSLEEVDSSDILSSMTNDFTIDILII